MTTVNTMQMNDHVFYFGYIHTNSLCISEMNTFKEIFLEINLSHSFLKITSAFSKNFLIDT